MTDDSSFYILHTRVGVYILGIYLSYCHSRALMFLLAFTSSKPLSRTNHPLTLPPKHFGVYPAFLRSMPRRLRGIGFLILPHVTSLSEVSAVVVSRHLRYHIVTTTARPATIRNIFPFCRIPALIAPLRFSLLSHHCDNRASPLVPICALRTYLLLSKPKDYPTITEGLPKDNSIKLTLLYFYCIYT